MATGTTTIVYPETDGMPLPDGEFQAPIYRRVVTALEGYYENVPGARVNGDTFIYYVEGNPRRSVSPDCYVALNLSEDAIASIERNNVYLLWEVGKAPDFVLEIGSESTAGADLGRKRDLYADIGVAEYWRYDSTGEEFYGEPLVGERLVQGEYQRFELRHEREGTVWAHSEVLNLDLWWVDGELQFWDPATGRRLLSMFEAIVRAKSEEFRADRAEAEREGETVARQEAEAERDRETAARQEAEAEIDRLRKRLAELEE